MFVTLETLIAYDLGVTTDDEDKIDSLVENNERNYLDLCLSVALSDELTDATKTDERFTNLLNSISIDGLVRSIGVDRGVNYYIYSLLLASRYNDQTQSGITVLNPENSVQIDPNPSFKAVHNVASEASKQCVYIINASIEDYPEYTEAEELSEISFYN